MQAFEYANPKTTEEAVKLLASEWGNISRIAKFHPIGCQSLCRHQVFGQRLIHLGNKVPEHRKVMGLRKFDLATHEQGFEKLFGGLLSMESHVVIITDSMVEQNGCRLQVFLGFVQPLLYKVPSYLLRGSHTGPLHTYMLDRPGHQ